MTTRHGVFDVNAAGKSRWTAAGNDRFAEYKAALFGGYAFGSVSPEMAN